MNDVDLSKASGMSKAALILGICAIIPFVGSALGLAAIIIGIIDLVKISKKESGEPGKTKDITGIILGFIFPFIGTGLVAWGITACATRALLNAF